MKRRISPSLARVRELLDYDADSGVLTWRICTSNRVKVGDVAGWSGEGNCFGYTQISIDGILYLAHHLIWFYVYGEWPIQIDHRDLDKSNNKLDNLRLATQSQNCGNLPKPKHNTSGYKGVSWEKKRNYWIAQISLNKKRYYLGAFDTKEQAHAAYLNAATRNWGEFARAT